MSVREEALVRFRNRLAGGPRDITARATYYREPRILPAVWRWSWLVKWRRDGRFLPKDKPSRNLLITVAIIGFIISMVMPIVGFLAPGPPIWLIVFTSTVSWFPFAMVAFLHMCDERKRLSKPHLNRFISDERARNWFIAWEVSELRKAIIGESSDLVQFVGESQRALRKDKVILLEAKRRIDDQNCTPRMREAMTAAHQALDCQHQSLQQTHDRVRDCINRLESFFDEYEKSLVQAVGDADLIIRAARQAGEVAELIAQGDQLVDDSLEAVTVRLQELQSATPRLAEATAQQLAEHTNCDFSDELEIIDRTVAALVDIEDLKV